VNNTQERRARAIPVITDFKDTITTRYLSPEILLAVIQRIVLPLCIYVHKSWSSYHGPDGLIFTERGYATAVARLWRQVVCLPVSKVDGKRTIYK